MPKLPPIIDQTLDRLRDHDHLRALAPASDLVDFTSNDYLGLAQESMQRSVTGATGSRLLSGNRTGHEEIERFGADFFRSEGALLFNSGYVANLGLLGSVAKRGDTILYDAEVHASIRECIFLSESFSYKFRHNDLDHLRFLLQKASGSVFVVTEGLFSMGGTLAPLPDLVLFCRKNSAHLIVDEAHSTGIYGPQGSGLVVEMGLENEVFARMHSFGKAPGWMGGMVVGAAELKEFLVNRSRPFIYTPALPNGLAEGLVRRLERIALMDPERQQLWDKRPFLAGCLPGRIPDFRSPGVPIVHPGNREIRELAGKVQAAGYDVRPILSPTVKAGQEQLRIVLHHFNTQKDLGGLADALRNSL